MVLGLIKAGAGSYWLALRDWSAWLEADIVSVGSLDIVSYRPWLLSGKSLQCGKLLVWSLTHIAAFVFPFVTYGSKMFLECSFIYDSI